MDADEDAEMDDLLAAEDDEEADDGDDDDEDEDDNEDEPDNVDEDDGVMAADVPGGTAVASVAKGDVDEEDEAVAPNDEGTAKEDPSKAAVATEGEAAAPARRGKPKDPRAPKRPSNPYQAFAGAERARLKEIDSPLLKDLKALGAALGDKWSEVPQAEKDEQQAAYDRKKAEWDKLMAEYKKTSHYKEFQREFAVWKDAKDMKKLIKKQKAVTPVRPKNAYMAFTAKVREEIQGELKGLSPGEVAKKLAARWQALSAKDQEAHQVRAHAAREKWLVEMNDFKRTEQFRECVDELADLELKQGLRRLKEEYGDLMPKRPPNQCMVWQATAGAKGSLKAISEQFAALPEAERLSWKEKADQLRAEFSAASEAFKASKEGQQFAKKQQVMKQKVALSSARKKYLVDAPKKVPGVQVLCMTDIPGRTGKWATLSAEDQKWWEEEHSRRMEEYERQMEKFKTTENWRLFEKAINAGSGKKKGKGKGKAKAKAAQPESMPQKPSKARNLWMQEQKGAGLNLSELCKKWDALGEEGQRKYNEQAEKALEAYKADLAVWVKTPEGKKYNRAYGIVPKKPIDAVPESMPQKPSKARNLWMQEQKGAGMNLSELGKKWDSLGEEGQRKYNEQAEKALEAYKAELVAWVKTPEGKKYNRTHGVVPKPSDVVPESMPQKPSKARNLWMQEQKGSGMKLSEQNKKWDALGEEGQRKYIEQADKAMEAYKAELISWGKTAEGKKYNRAHGLGPKPSNGQTVAVPESMPQKPPKPRNLWMKEQKGRGLNLSALGKEWDELGEEGQRKYKEQSEMLMKTFTDDLAAWEKSKDGKKYTRAMDKQDQKAKEVKARGKYLKEEPVKPKNAQTMFSDDKKADLLKSDPKIGARELTKRVAALWASADTEEKKKYENKAQSAMDVYEFEMEQYKESPAYQRYVKAVGLSDGQGSGRGRGKGGGRGTKRKAEDDEFGLEDDDDDLGELRGLLDDESDGLDLSDSDDELGLDSDDDI